MNTHFEMVAKTFQGLEGVLAEELRELGASDIEQGKRMVSFRGDLAMLYKANFCCRTALRILKPFYTFEATDPDELYAKVKEFDWGSLMSVTQTFSIDTVAFSDEFRHSQFVTYRVKDGIVDWFRDHLGDDRRPRVRLDGADIMFNVHISGRKVTLSLDSSGESLHKRGWRRQQTEAPINEVLAAGIILMTGWKGDVPFVDPMCGSGTFLIEAAMIAAGINPGLYRQHFAFENWPDFNAELLDEIYNDDSREREVTVPIIGADISPRALEIARTNAKNAGVERYLTLDVRPISQWTEAPQPAGVLVTNPPYGRRIGADDMNALYGSIGKTLKHIFTGYHAWIIGYEDEYFREIGLAPSQKIAVNNGGLDCELREYVIFEGKKADFRARGGAIKEEREQPRRREPRREGRGENRGEGRPGKPFRKFDKKAERPGKPDRSDRSDRSERSERSERPAGEGRRPLRLDRLGRQPSIPAEKTVVLNRPAWRTRKNKDGEAEK
ncbi:MAG: THUMP domain-containing protein [Muribaculaceae bacterium]|nr:THUMP domain-containing protein [Muribaculaceae bacterium]